MLALKTACFSTCMRRGTDLWTRTFPSMSMTFRAERAILISVSERPRMLLEDILTVFAVSITLYDAESRLE